MNVQVNPRRQRPVPDVLPCSPVGRFGAPHLLIDGLDVIEGNEGGHRPLICEA